MSDTPSALCKLDPAAPAGVFRCSRCGYRRASRDPARFRRACPAAHGNNAPPPMPSILHRVETYAAARARWKSAGKPTRTPERVQAIFDEHCSACPFLVDGACRLCGCLVSRRRRFANKLAWATETCPDSPPRWR